MFAYEATPRAGILPAHRNPYSAPQFRSTVDMHIVKGDLVGVGMEHIKDAAKSTSTGNVWEYANAWLAPDSVQKSEGVFFDMNSKGREGYLRSYNSVVLSMFAAKDSKMQFVVDSVQQVGERSLTFHTSITVLKKNMSFVEKIRCLLDFNTQYQITSMSASPLHPAITSPAVDAKLSHDTVAAHSAFITPVESAEKLLLCKTASDELEEVVVQAPRYDRPCLHNIKKKKKKNGTVCGRRRVSRCCGAGPVCRSGRSPLPKLASAKNSSPKKGAPRVLPAACFTFTQGRSAPRIS
eukprot:TRINITY_DN181_c0_g1_i6.p1 TRINITY_DN181_c0_g1~~TRINITY_DN181_c0_g1_i6.p1  ORF type:complete len:305 (+),score=43.20 TRINITY_DN181_c0_g1_i6:36-917(+)